MGIARVPTWSLKKKVIGAVGISMLSALVFAYGYKIYLYASLPSWAAMWAVRDKGEIDVPSFSKRFNAAILEKYPVGSSGEKLVSDCKQLGYLYKSSETYAKNVSLSKSYPCVPSTCGLPSHAAKHSAEEAYISWCEEDGKITWIKGNLVFSMD